MRHRWIAWLLALAMLPVAACAPADAPARVEIARAQAGDLNVILLAGGDALSKGSAVFVLEFRSRATDQLVDVGDIRVSATMPMAGMAPMLGTVTARRTGVAGRYDVESDLGMVGSWRIGVEWNEGAGNGSAFLHGRVQ